MTEPRTARRHRGENEQESEDRVRATQAYQTLRELIVHGRVAAGTRLAENEVARRLGMSRTPVRSALQRLQAEGYVVASGGGRLARIVVAPLTREDARETFHLVAALEGVAARATALLPAAARQRVVARMRRLNQELRAIHKSRWPDPDRRVENDDEFHHCYMDSAGPRLRALHDSLKPQVERYNRVYVSRLTATSVAEHDAIVEAIAAGDPDRAQHAVEANWREAAERLARVIDVAGEKGSW